MVSTLNTRSALSTAMWSIPCAVTGNSGRRVQVGIQGRQFISPAADSGTNYVLGLLGQRGVLSSRASAAIKNSNEATHKNSS